VLAGKSSVLQAILSKMMVQEGRLDVGGTIAYVPQSPWVQNLSLRDNILFGMPYDEQKYKAVIHACALELDLKILPNGRCHSCPRFRQTAGWSVPVAARLA
jgi:ABC-type transport system involved in cytochrome bd biosynthesis fused ATPase/permease subunit